MHQSEDRQELYSILMINKITEDKSNKEPEDSKDNPKLAFLDKRDSAKILENIKLEIEKPKS